MSDGADTRRVDTLTAWLRSHGVKVHLYAHDLPYRGGMYRSETQEIFVNVEQARPALLTLAHEAGHWIGHLVRPKKHSYQRERQAFIFGWKALAFAGIEGVTREEWIAEERRRRQTEATTSPIDTSGVPSRSEGS